MPAKTGSRNGLSYGWALGENNWNTGMDGNLTFIDRFGVHLSFKSFLNTPPGSPAAGDCHVIDTVPTGVWAGKAGQVAVYDDGAWRYGVPRTGWRAYCEADERLYVYDGGWVPTASEWSAATVDQAEAEAGTATTRRAWTAQRVRQAIAAWWNSITNIDGKAIGQTTPAAGSFTTLSASGNTTLGDASTDTTTTVNGYMGVGGAADSTSAVKITSSSLTSIGQYGVFSTPVFSSAATASSAAFRSSPRTAAAAFTASSVFGYRADDAVKGAGSTITSQHGVYIIDQTQGANNYGITSLVSAGTNKWNIYASGTAQNYFAGNVGIGTSSPISKLHVEGINGGGESATLLSNVSTVVNTTVGLYLSPTNGNLTNGSIRAGVIKAINVGSGATALTFSTNGTGADPTERLRIDSAGNLGLGVTPSVWRSSWRALQFGASGSLASRSDVFGTSLSNNAFINSAGDSAYIGTGTAAQYNLIGNEHRWLTAPSGTTGDPISFTQAMKLDGDGNWAVGSTSILGGARAQIEKSNNANYSPTFTTGTTGAHLVLRDQSATGTYSTPFSTLVFGAGNLGAAYTTITCIRESSQHSAIAFGTALASANPTERLRINSTGTVRPGADNTQSLGEASFRWSTVHTSGITFPATQASSADANTLDDYEEGTWTPTINGASGSITSYSARVATYTKIGNMCFLQAYIAISNIGTIAGSLNLGGLPFTSNITTNAYQQGHGRGNGFNALAAPANGLVGYQIGNNAVIATIQVGTATGVSVMDAAALKNGCDLTVSVAYRVA